MFVYNFKVNRTGIFKMIMIFFAMIIIGLMFVTLFNILKDTKHEKNLIDDSIPSSEVATLTPENYTNILKAVHNDVDTYIGQKISFSGYVYRVNGIKENEFILARDMDVGNHQTVVVGFLCSHEKASDFENYTWINITGEITKGSFNNVDMPILKITQIDKINKPSNDTVPMPDDSFVPTCVIY